MEQKTNDRLSIYVLVYTIAGLIAAIGTGIAAWLTNTANMPWFSVYGFVGLVAILAGTFVFGDYYINYLRNMFKQTVIPRYKFLEELSVNVPNGVGVAASLILLLVVTWLYGQINFNQGVFLGFAIAIFTGLVVSIGFLAKLLNLWRFTPWQVLFAPIAAAYFICTQVFLSSGLLLIAAAVIR